MPRSDQPDLFGASPPSAPGRSSGASSSSVARRVPLAARMRPRRLEEVVGQAHLIGEEALLPRLLRTRQLGSVLLYGPPGSGKTTLAEVIAAELGGRFVRLNAVLSNVAELRDVLRLARHYDEPTVLFIDEIHRFNKAQQDLLLPDVEAGTVTLIGATTHNPGFYVIPPLLSRSHLFKLEPLGEEAVAGILRRALEDTERGLGGHAVLAEQPLLLQLARMADGDLRRALNSLETLVLSLAMGAELREADLEAFARERQIRYDANEDEHYDTASAFIKSLRGGDPDAGLYWLAKMLIGGEDPRFIARRLVIFASEDVGLADSRALSLAVATFQACDVVGLPECELNLAHCVAFLAASPKSNATTAAISAAKREIRENGLQPIPLWLRDSHTQLNKSLGQGEGYRYSHEYPEAISGQEYLVEPKRFLELGRNGAEVQIAERLARWRTLKAERQARE
ncbi:MAG: replication-associated recombination protein A [Verrucomicrobiota bacterium]